MKVLVTGGAGFIGSHTCIELLEKGYEIIVLDNLSNSSEASLKRVEQITKKKIQFVRLDLRDKQALRDIFVKYKFNYVIHFAGLKSVKESISNPILYYDNNVICTVYLIELMSEFNIKNLVFSSSATVYGNPETVPVSEHFPLSATNPYGQSKLMIEYILKDVYSADHSWNIALLRYFNPIGAHPSGLIGEHVSGTPNNLMPYIMKVATKQLDRVNVFGGDYPTHDGTGVRDYIHVVDLAKAHVLSMEAFQSEPTKNGKLLTLNIGTGVGYSVLDLIKNFENVSGMDVPYKIVERRAGDVAKCFASPKKAETEIGWKAAFGIEDMCKDAWRWQKNNIKGYD